MTNQSFIYAYTGSADGEGFAGLLPPGVYDWGMFYGIRYDPYRAIFYYVVMETTSSSSFRYFVFDYNQDQPGLNQWLELVSSENIYGNLGAGKDGEGNVISETYAKKSEVGGGSGSTNVFKIINGYALATTVGQNYAIDSGNISPAAELIKKGDIAVDAQNNVGLFQTDYDDADIQTVKTIFSATNASGKTYTHNITIDCGNNGFVTVQALSESSTAFATVADFISFLSGTGLKANTKTPLSASGFYIQTAGSTDIMCHVIGIGQYGNRTDGIGICYYRTDVSVGRFGYQLVNSTAVEIFNDIVT